jgi:aspartate/methionine/tyrosine aminotransferase
MGRVDIVPDAVYLIIMNPLAEELNAALAGTAVERLLSDLGRRMYFPKGILTQSAEADEKAKRFNATIGMAYSHGEPLILDAIRAGLPTLSATEAVAYATTAGVPALRRRWKVEMEAKNPSLKGLSYSLPVVVPGLTAAISYVADLFLGPGDSVVMPDLHWPNYRLIVEERKMAAGLTYPIFAGNEAATTGRGPGDRLPHFNVEGLEARLREAGARRGKACAILNFPNNPTGYTPMVEEADAIVAALLRVASEGTDLLVVVDDAYFGLQYEKGLLMESIFARLAQAHARILAVKADGPTKEDYVWGFRTGFVTFAGAGLAPHAYDALVKKLMGVIRSSVSNSSAPVQHLLLKALDAPGRAEEKARYRALLEGRYVKVRDFLASHELPSCLSVLPFNSGYFMSFECKGISAEALRVRLLENGIGTISIQDRYLRVAFSSVEASQVDELYTEICGAAATIQAGA